MTAGRIFTSPRTRRRACCFRNHHDGTFTEEGSERGAALSDEGTEQAGMGVAVGDYDLDGSLDIFKTHFSDDTAILYKNDGTGNFIDVTNKAGIGVETRYISWGTGFADFDNDGWPRSCGGYRLGVSRG